MDTGDRARILPLIGLIEDRMAAMSPDEVIDCLVEDCQARHRFADGTYHLRIAGVSATATSGAHALLLAWMRHARKAIAK